MGSRLRKLLILAVTAIILIVVLLLTAPLFVPAELYKDQVIAKIEKATGRSLEIRGDIGLRFVPSVQLNMGDVHLSNPKGFAQASMEDMIALRELQLSLGFFDILQGRIAIHTLNLVNPVIYLTHNTKGEANWVFEPETLKNTKKEAVVGNIQSGFTSELSLPSVKITDGTVVYQESPDAEPISLNQLNATIKMPSMNDQLTVKADTNWNEKLPLKLTARLETLASWMDGEESDYSLTLKSDGSLLDLTLDGKATPAGKNSKATPQLQGDMKLAISSLKKLSAQLENPLMQTAKGDGKISLRSLLRYDNDKISLQGTTLSVDESTISGSGELILGGVRPKLTAELATTNIVSLDSLLSRGEPSITRKSDEEGPEEPRRPAAKWDSTPLLEDTAILKTADADVSLAIGGLTADKLKIGAMRIKLLVNNGTVNLNIPEFAFYNGQATASAIITPQNKNTLFISKTARLTNSDIGTFLREAYGFDRLRGVGNLGVSVSTSGASMQDFIRTLDGNGRFALKNGALKGFNLADIVRETRTLVKSIKDKSIAAEMGAKDDGAETDFSSLNGSFTIVNGVVTNPDLVLKAPLLDVTGSGTINLPQKTVNYHLKPTIIGNIEGETRTQETSGGVTIPVRVTGNFNALKFTPDAAGLVKDAIKDPKGTAKKLGDDVRGLRDDVKSLFKGL